jgi:hypothetical protein
MKTQTHVTKDSSEYRLKNGVLQFVNALKDWEDCHFNRYTGDHFTPENRKANLAAWKRRKFFLREMGGRL